MLQQVPTRAFHVMAKPSGSDCNLNCDYCFISKNNPFTAKSQSRIWTMTRWKRMSVTISLPANRKTKWLLRQGGEPTLLGLAFYRRAVALQAKYGAGRKISNSFQTNGVLLDDEWCAFLAEHHFLVGLSLDGPPEIHNQYRVTKGGRPTHKLVMRALTLLQNIMSTITCWSALIAPARSNRCRYMIFVRCGSRIHPVYSGGRAHG